MMIFTSLPYLTPRSRCRVIGYVLAILTVAATVRAEVRLPSVFGDHMVLQRDMALPVWGWAAAGEKVTVTLGDRSVSTVAGPDGAWKLKLPALPAGGPHELTVAGQNKLTLRGVLVGEVWICSGQSNMEMRVEKSTKGAEAAAQATHPRMRLLQIPDISSETPQADVEASWQPCTPETAASFSAAAYFFGREIHRELDVPVGLIESCWGGTAIRPWLALDEAGRADFEKFEPIQRGWRKTGTLYNGMIHPLVPFGIRGAIWYQGEANNFQRDGLSYELKMKLLIDGWREVWGEGDFPFYYVQLAPYNYTGYRKNVTAQDLPELRQAQLNALKINNTGMAVITDLGGGLHPGNKLDVGKRLALWALAKTYGKIDLAYSGPLFKSFAVEAGKARIRFDYAVGMKSNDGKPLDWFEIAGEDRKFHPAQAVVDGETVVVSCNQVPKPVAVRFGSHQLAKPNLVNGAGLPASPFLTDTWPQVETPVEPDTGTKKAE